MSFAPIRAAALLMFCSLAACSSPPQQATEIPVHQPDTAPARTISQPEPEPTPMPADTPAFTPVPVNVLLGRIDQARDSEFVRISTRYTAKPSIYLRKEAYEAFERMHAAAQKDGIRLEIISAMRNFDYQKGIWERKWSGATKVGGKDLSVSLPDPVERARAILRYSSMPGTSRHHWGTDIDLNSLDNEWFASGQGKKVYDWLRAHASEYGYCQPYTHMDEQRPAGYQEEKWHWSYMPIAANFLAAYEAAVDYSHINGFKGAEAAEGMQVIRDYVGGIGPQCREWK